MAEPLAFLEARDLVRRYPGGKGGSRSMVTAVGGVRLAVQAGEVLGLVGRSGAGKSTLARMLAGLERPDGGEALVEGEAWGSMSPARARQVRRRVQLVLQSPRGALDPLQTAGGAVAEALAVGRLLPRRADRARALELLRLVGLPGAEALAARRAHELSGGERARVVLARALACEPGALVLDEPVSALDASARGLLLNLLLELRGCLGLAMLLIAHDLPAVAAVCDRVVVMERGSIVEEGTPGVVLRRPEHAATRALLAAARALGVAGAPNPGSGAGVVA